MLTVIVLCHGDRQAALLERLDKKAFDGADLVTVVFSDVENAPSWSFPFIGVRSERIFSGFNAGYNRDVALSSILSRTTTSVVFMDGDCVPSPGLIEHHKKSLTLSHAPLVTFGARRENGNVDMRELVFRHNGIEFAPTLYTGQDVECSDITSIRNHRTVWSCNFGANEQALQMLRENDRLFHPMFDGHWGGEDTGVALAAYYSQCKLVGLDPKRSYVRHINHDHHDVTRKNLERLPEFEKLMCSRRSLTNIQSGDHNDQPTATI